MTTDSFIDNYFSKQPPLQLDILNRIRKLVQTIAPNAEEAMSYGVPSFKLNGTIVIVYAAFKNHVGVYPEPETIKAFEGELSDYETTKGTIKFSLEKPIPYDLIEKIIKYRVSKVLAGKC